MDGTSVLEMTTLPTMATGTGLQPVSADAELAAACARGETPAFERLYREHGRRMKSIALNHLGNLAEAEDAVQETFLRIHRGAKGFSAEAAFSTWIYRILLNVCYDVLRRRKRRIAEEPIAVVEGRRAESAGSGDATLRLALRRALASLPRLRRDVFVLFEVEGFSHREIAKILDIQESYSKWLLYATRRDLQRLLQREDGEMS